MAALLGLILTLAASAQEPEPTGLEAFAPRDLFRAGESPTRRYYKRIRERDGAVSGRYRSRRRERFALWSLRSGVVVRLEERQRAGVIEIRRFDPMGQPVTTVRTPRQGWPSVTVHLVPEREIGISGWEERSIPGGSVELPVPLIEGDGGVEAWVLGGRLEVWHDPRPADVTTDAFWQGLIVGCGCDLVDRVATWVDGRPGVRFRFARGTDVQELWAIPYDERGARGVWFAGFHAPDVDAASTSLRVAPGRALIALVDLDDLDDLVASEGDP